MSSITIPAMPELWNMDSLIVSHNDIAGSLAKWAIKQSPYIYPENLSEAIAQFMGKWPYENYIVISSKELFKTIIDTIEKCPLIQAWNIAKKGEGNIFYSRYSQPKPDYDFIDLFALTGNITHDIVLFAQVNKAQDLRVNYD